MAEQFTPPAGAIRRAWIDAHPFRFSTSVEEREAEFDRWLAQHDAQVKAESWDEGYDAHADDTGLSQMMRDMGEDNGNPYRAES